MTAAPMAELGFEDFSDLAGRYRAELLAHCYRMLGSVQDAEDQVQETLLRAWRAAGEFEGRASVRTWLYRIATNACLRALENRRRRPLPASLTAASGDPLGPPPPEHPEVPWLQPFPDALLAGGPGDPASIVGTRMSMRLALIAALQYLPGRQRAVLILRDVLGWRAAEVAELLEVSTAAVNSLLQRARARLKELAPSPDDIREPTAPRRRALLDRYQAAFENADVDALMKLLRADAVFEMPPRPGWFAGRVQIGRFLRAHVLRSPGGHTLVPTAANGQPAFAVYQRDPDGVPRAHGIQVLTFQGAALASVISFNDPLLLAAFGLPEALPDGSSRPPDGSPGLRAPSPGASGLWDVLARMSACRTTCPQNG
jgi:RNA polymerase sigma-70 factor, ECF subfamily